MKIAHLILAHQDPYHIARLVERLCAFSDVYIHIDAKQKIEDFSRLISRKNCYFTTKRYKVYWGGVQRCFGNATTSK